MGGKGSSFDLKLKAVSLAVTAALAAVTPDASNAGATISGTQTSQEVWDSGDLTVQSGASIAASNTHTAVLAIPSASLGTLTNNGTISGTIGFYNNADVAAISNSGNVTGTLIGIQNESGATISALLNSGTISGASAIYNSGSIGTLGNSGTISGTQSGVYNSAFGTIDTLTNIGTISTSNNGIANDGTSGTLGTIKTLTNSGLISGGYSGINNMGTIGTLANSGTISGISGGGVFVGGAGGIGLLTNSGTISGAVSGIFNLGTTDTITNSGVIKDTTAFSSSTAVYGGGLWNEGTIGTLTNSGTISGNLHGINNAVSVSTSTIGTTTTIGTISTLTNSGAIVGGAEGINNAGTIGALTNSGTITGGSEGIYNTGTIDTLTNASGGTISATAGNSAISNSGTIGMLANSGAISASGYYGILNNGTVVTLNNSGAITSSNDGIHNNSGGTIDTLINSGTITGTGFYGIVNESGGSIGSLTNSGLLIGGHSGVDNLGSIGALTNSGSISGSYTGVHNGGSIGTLTNSGTISAGDSGIHNNSGTIGTLTNSGTISAGHSGISNSGTIGVLANSGVIVGGATGIGNFGSIGTLINSGTIQSAGGATGSGVSGIYNYNGTIGTLSNSGAISGRYSGIYNSGTIGTLTNSGTIAGSYYAIGNYSNGSIGPIVNSGVIEGNIENDTSNALTISGGSGSVFGTLTGYGGTATIGTLNSTSSNLMFASGNLLLNDHINVGSNTVTNSAATLQVNNAITITGNYSQGSAATLLIGVASGAVTTGTLASDSGYGRLVVSGSATVASGSSVTLQKTGTYAFVAGQRYVVIDASSSGTSYNAGSLKYSINGYTSVLSGATVTDSGRSDLVVTVVSATENSTSGTTTSGTGTGTTTTSTTTTSTTTTSTSRAPDLATRPNAVSSLDGLLGYTGISTDLLNLYNAATALSVGTSSEATRAGVQLGPASQNSASRAATSSTFDVLTVVANRADSMRLSQSYGESGGQSGVSTGESAPNKAVWGQVLGGHASQGNSAEADGFSANYGGLLFGADRAINDRWRAGGAFSYTTSAINNTGDSAGDSTHVNAYGLIGYASYTAPTWYANLSAGAVLQHYDTTRVVSFTGFSGTAQGRFNGQQYVMRAEAGYPLALGAYTLTPLSSLTYSYLRQNGYTESGGSGAALSVQASHATSVRSDLGAKIERGFATSYGVLVPDVGVAWRHEYVHGRQLTTSSFTADASGVTTFTTTGANPIQDMAVVSAGVTLVRASNLTLTARYELQAAPRYISQTGSVRLRQLF
jgi:uncharacterized protein with beta-barrel porin domain